MSTLLAPTAPAPATPAPSVRAAVEGRPPSSTWSTRVEPLTDHPRLAFGPGYAVEPGVPQPSGHRLTTVQRPWSPGPSPALPDPRPWSASLALGLAEVLQGRRPVGQLSRWVDDRVQATLTVAVRRHGPGTARAARPVLLRSVHLQFPTATAVEVAAHVQVDGRSSALAFRLQGWGDRWLCTALDLGPGVSGRRGARGTS
jgi:hypothetical protein